MAKGKKTGGRNWKKGVSANPLGARAHNQEVKKIRRLTNDQIAEVGSVILENDPDTLKKLIKKTKGQTTLQWWIANTAYWAGKRGDGYMLNTLLDRISGKIKETKEIDLKTSEPQVRIYLPDNGRDNDPRATIEARATKKVIDEIIGEDDSKP